MNAPENVFKGDTTQLENIDIDSPLANAKAQTCEYFLEPLGKTAREAEGKNEMQKASVYRFLQVIVGFHPSFDTPSQPFVPMWQSQVDGRRSLIPADLTAADIEVVRVLATQTTNSALRARLHDVLWGVAKDHIAGTEAAACYTTQAEALDAARQWTFAVTSFKRALYLAGRFGRNKPLFDNTAKSAIAAVKRTANGADAFSCGQLMRLILQFDVGEPAEFAAIAASIANAAQACGDLYQAKAFWDLEADWQKLAKNSTAEQKARLAAAEAAVNLAENRAIGKGASFAAAASLMGKSIEELRQAGATKERISELRQRMNEWQERSLAEFQTYSSTIDISGFVQRARDHVRGCDFPTAILKMAFGQELADPKKLCEEIKQLAKQAPEMFLIGGSIVDQQGRTQARKEGLFNLRGEALDAALEAESFSNAAQSHWPLRVDGFIEPARAQILNDHKPTFQDLLFVVSNNPFIPPGHEGIFLRGLHAGFHGDFVVATHLLTPQIENSLRYVLESHGVDVSNLMSDGTQPVKVLGAIFGMAQTKQIFGDKLCFELRGCLIEKTGYDFRNRVAHGFVQEGECYQHAGVTVWWLVLRICLMPIFQTIAQKQKASSVPSATATTDSTTSAQPPAPEQRKI
jgi:hypothetical protein